MNYSKDLLWLVLTLVLRTIHLLLSLASNSSYLVVVCRLSYGCVRVQVSLLLEVLEGLGASIIQIHL